MFFLAFFVLGSVFFPLGAQADVFGQGADTWTGAVANVLSGAVQIVSTPILWVFNVLLYAVFAVFGLLLILAGILLDWAINPANFAIVVNNGAVYESWKLIRDVLNIFFIFFLLFAAFATVFQIDKYSYKKIMLNLVIMALLVNFSYPISRFIIDVSNVFFYGILSLGGFGDGGLSGTLAQGMNVVGIISPSTGFVEATFHASTLTTKLIFSNVFLFIAAITFLIIGALFIIRIAVLTVLIIFSPVGFVAGVFPGTKKFADEWWSALLNQAFFAPVMALVLVIAIKVMMLMNAEGNLQKSIDEAVGAQSAGADYSSLIVGGMSLAIPLIILWVGLGSAKKFGAIGADMVQKYATTGMKFVGMTPLLFAGRKYEKWATDDSNKYRRFTRFTAPSVLKQSWDNWRKESLASDKAPVERAAADTQDNFNALFGDHTNHGFAVRQHQAAKVAKEMSEVSTNSEYVIDELGSYREKKEYDGVVGSIKALIKDNNLNDLLGSLSEEEIKKWGLETEDIEDENGKVIGKKVIISPENFQKVMNEMLIEAGGKRDSEEVAMDIMTLSDMATAAGNYGAGGLANFYYDEKTGKKKWRLSTPKEQAEWAAGKVKNLESQARQRMLHPDSMFEYYIDDQGKKHYTDLSTSGLEIAKTFTQGDVKNAERSRDDLKQGIHELAELARTLKANNQEIPERLAKALRDNAVMGDYMSKIDGFYNQEGGKSSGDKWRGDKPQPPLKPGETMSPGGIVIPAGSRTV